jgi:CheY-like chemotaxis protein
MENDVSVLIVEDEAALLSVLQDVMENGGFKITAASNAEEAITLLNAGDAKYRALITDVNLAPGGLTGWDVARHAREMESELPVV